MIILLLSEQQEDEAEMIMCRSPGLGLGLRHRYPLLLRNGQNSDDNVFIPGNKNDIQS